MNKKEVKYEIDSYSNISCSVVNIIVSINNINQVYHGQSYQEAPGGQQCIRVPIRRVKNG